MYAIRSYYAAYMYKCKEIKNIEKDFEETLTKCIEVTKDTNKNQK